MRLLSYPEAFSTTNPFRAGPVGLVVGFLVEIYPLSLFPAMCARGSRSCVVIVGSSMGKELNF